MGKNLDELRDAATDFFDLSDKPYFLNLVVKGKKYKVANQT